MRDNGPITDRGIELADGDFIVSRTDTKGRITFVNKAFCDISGYNADELLGAPHNIVRHPHMPPAAFADLWATIRKGLPWEGVVKNRTKSGDYYWVKANVTPILEGDAIVGYTSIRTRPTRAQVAAAEGLYAKLRAARGVDFDLAEGEVVPRGLRHRLAAVMASVTGRLVAAFVLMIAMMVVVGGVSLMGMRDSNDALRSVYADRTVPVGRLGDIIDRMRDNLQQTTLLIIDLRDGSEAKVVDGRIQRVRANIAEITRLWDQYGAASLGAEERALADRFAGQRGAFVRDGLLPALQMAQDSDPLRLESHYNAKLVPLFEAAHATNRDLLALQIRVAGEEYAEAEADFREHAIGSLAAVLVCVGLAAAFGAVLLATVKRPLRRFEADFDAIARGNVSYDIALPAAREFRRSAAFLRALKAKLGYSVKEREERDRQAEEDRRRALGDMASTIEAEAAQAVERVAERTAAMAGDAEAMARSAERVSRNSQSVAAAAEQALANAQAVAAATEQMAASINGITAQVAQSGAVTRAAVSDSRRTREAIAALSTEVARIGEVTTLIAEIAGQTNLLALNATIEAARAGEAGKGFAVVASEVKNLATQTARSTEEITRQVGAIQMATREAVEAVAGIGRSIAGLDEVSGAIAQAMEEQSAATQEITRNVVETSAAAREVSALIGEVSRDAAETGSQASSVSHNSGAVSHGIQELRQVLVRVVRTSTKEADRRMLERYRAEMPCVVRIGGGVQHGTIGDISEGGATLVGAGEATVGQAGSLLIRDLGIETGFEVRGVSPVGLHVRFVNVDEALRSAIRRITGVSATGQAA